MVGGAVVGGGVPSEVVHRQNFSRPGVGSPKTPLLQPIMPNTTCSLKFVPSMSVYLTVPAHLHTAFSLAHHLATSVGGATVGASLMVGALVGGDLEGALVGDLVGFRVGGRCVGGGVSAAKGVE